MSFKAALTRAKQPLFDDLQVGNAQMKRHLSFPCEPYHILRCLKEAQDYMMQKNAEKENLLAGLRRNGFLSYRPDFATGLLRRTDDADWAKCFPEGSQRIPEPWTTLNENLRCLTSKQQRMLLMKLSGLSLSTARRLLSQSLHLSASLGLMRLQQLRLPSFRSILQPGMQA